MRSCLCSGQERWQQFAVAGCSSVRDGLHDACLDLTSRFAREQQESALFHLVSMPVLRAASA